MPATPPTMYPSDKEVADWLKFRQTEWAEIVADDPNRMADVAAIEVRCRGEFALCVAAKHRPVSGPRTTV